MKHQIVAVHLNKPSRLLKATKEITKVKLSTGEIQSIFLVVANLMNHEEYYYIFHNDMYSIDWEYTIYGNPFIKTRQENSLEDNLLNLPKF